MRKLIPGQKSRKVRNLMLQSPFKSMLARTAIFALLLALAISFVTVGLAQSATAQSANDDPCEANSDGTEVTCDYDENGTDPVANFSAMDPEGESILWSLAGPDAADFDITGGVLTFKEVSQLRVAVGPRVGRRRQRHYRHRRRRSRQQLPGNGGRHRSAWTTPGSLDLAQFERHRCHR